MSYPIDSDWLIDVLVGVPSAVGVVERLSGQDLAVSVVSYGELFEGALGDANPEAEMARCRALLERFTPVPLSDPIMEIFARNRKLLRDSGRMIPDLDLLIGATAAHHDRTLLTRNLRHFGRVPDLKIYGTG